MIIAFSGLDGSGKTTHSMLAIEYIRGLGNKCVYRHVIRDSLSYFLLHNVLGRVSRGSKQAMEGGLRDKEKTKKNFIIRTIKKVFLLMDLLYFHLRHGFCKNKTSHNVVSDRYYYDELVQVAHLGTAGESFKRLYGKLIPVPDITFLLTVAPETAFKRKSEYDRSYFFDKADIYNSLGKEGYIKVVKEGSLEDVQAVIKAELKKLYS